MIAATSGGLGDIVYSIPVMRRLKVKTVYVKVNYYYPPHGNLYLSSKRLLEEHGFEVLPTSGAYNPMTFEPSISYDYNMDSFRNQPFRGTNHIIISYLNEFKLSHDNWNEPWLNIEGQRPIEKPYSVVHRTNRWRYGSQVNWTKVIEDIQDSQPVFMGFDHEYDDFCKETGTNIKHVSTNDIWDAAVLIKHCEKFYGNQSVGLTLAQGLGKQYYLDRAPRKTNTMFFTSNEHLL